MVELYELHPALFVRTYGAMNPAQCAAVQNVLDLQTPGWIQQALGSVPGTAVTAAPVPPVALAANVSVAPSTGPALRIPSAIKRGHQRTGSSGGISAPTQTIMPVEDEPPVSGPRTPPSGYNPTSYQDESFQASSRVASHSHHGSSAPSGSGSRIPAFSHQRRPSLVHHHSVTLVGGIFF